MTHAEIGFEAATEYQQAWLCLSSAVNLIGKNEIGQAYRLAAEAERVASRLQDKRRAIAAARKYDIKINPRYLFSIAHHLVAQDVPLHFLAESIYRECDPRDPEIMGYLELLFLRHKPSRRQN